MRKLILIAVIGLWAFSPSLTAADLGWVFAAETGVLEFEKTDVSEDLRSSSVNGLPFDPSDYPYDDESNPRILSFVEYCYSYKSNMQSNYGLFIYVFNPAPLRFSETSLSNKIQMAVAWDGGGLPTDYYKFNLKFCGRSSGAGQNYKFYKFRVVDKVIDGKSLLDRINAYRKIHDARRYDVSGLELVAEGDAGVAEYTVGCTYVYRGYAEGYGADASDPSDLTAEVRELETVELDVRSANYRTGVSGLGAGHQWNVDTVYFSVPDSLLERYGRLQKIKAEWYEYKMKETVVTESSVLYDFIFSRIGIPTIGISGEYARSVYDVHIKQGGENFWNWAWNPIGNNTNPQGVTCDTLYNVFYLGDISKPLPASVIESYIRAYDRSYQSGVLPVENGSISADLFRSDADNGRVRGYNIVDADADNLFDILDYASTSPDWWDKVLDFGLWNTLINNLPNIGGGQSGVAPIRSVSLGDLSGSDSVVSERLLIEQSDLSALRSFYTASAAAGRTVFLYRFAVTDYYSVPLSIEKNNGLFDSGSWSDQAYMAMQTVFFDFDIIQLTFNKDGVYRVIPAVSNPIDIINDLTAPLLPEEFDWLRLLFMVVLLIVLAVVIAPFLPVIINALLWLIRLVFNLITYPFRLAAKTVKSVKRRK
jgi:hypothetical protein